MMRNWKSGRAWEECQLRPKKTKTKTIKEKKPTEIKIVNGMS